MWTYFCLFHLLTRICAQTEAVHHYDENGLVDHSQEPQQIAAIHSQEVEFVKTWLADFKFKRAH